MSSAKPSVLRQDLRAIWVDGIAYSAMVGIGETYIPAFALALGHSAVDAGLVATLPMLAGALLQLASYRGVAWIGSQRRWVVLNVAVQAASFLPLCAGALVGSMPAWLVYASAALYWASGLACGPAWNAWVETLVPRRVRIRYFARRSRALHVFVIVGLVSGGWILHSGSLVGRTVLAFALLFSFACLARTLSALALSRQSEPEPLPSGMRRVGYRDFAKRLLRERGGRLFAYMLSVQLAVQVAAPFFNPFMLGELGFGYAEHMGLLAAAVVGKFAALPLFARVAQRHGVRALLWVGGVAIIPAPAYWLLGGDWRWLCAAQVLAGASFAAWELATFLLYFEAIPREERTSVLALFNLANASAIAAGSIAGARLFAWLGGGADSYAALFSVSLALRLATLFFLRRVVVDRVEPRAVPTGTDAVRPSLGSLEEPVLPGVMRTGPERR